MYASPLAASVQSDRERNFYNLVSDECSVFRRNDPTRTESLNTEHSKCSLNAIPNRKALLQFDVWPHEVSYKSLRQFKLNVHSLIFCVRKFHKFFQSCLPDGIYDSCSFERVVFIAVIKDESFCASITSHRCKTINNAVYRRSLTHLFLEDFE